MEFARNKYLDRLVSRQGNGLIKVITGARRSGKSYLMNEIFYRYLIQRGVQSDHIIRFAFDADEDIDFLDNYYPNEPTRIKNETNGISVNAKKFRAYIKDHTNENDVFYLLLDEVQMLENFIGTLNGLLRHSNFDVYVTGSNSRFLSSDIATEFKGRGTVIHILPLSFSEYCIGLGMEPQNAWRRYIVSGGIPLVAKMQTEEEQIEYLTTLCEETYLKDVILHNGIRKQTELSETFDVLASVIGTPVNILKLVRTFKSTAKKDITDDTIAKFIDYLEAAFVISKVRRYNIKGRKYISSPFKLYFEDVGVRNARLGFRQIEETHIMENIIYNELRYRGYTVDVGELNINEKTDRTDINGKAIYKNISLEVDFIAVKGSQKYYIQSALSMESQSKQQQEKRSLYYIDDSFKKIIVTKNGLDVFRDEKGVEVIDLFHFLLHSPLD